jgi:hypothetical protein
LGENIQPRQGKASTRLPLQGNDLLKLEFAWCFVELLRLHAGVIVYRPPGGGN